MPDTALPTTTWFPVFTAFLGFVMAWISEWFRDRRTATREREGRDAARRLQLFERRTNFQRETLLNLQDAVAKLARAAGRMNFLDEMEYRKTGKWGGFLFPEDLDQDAHQANVTTMLLTSRVRDDHIRQMANELRGHASRVGISPSKEDETKALESMGALLEPLYERIGGVIRKLDDDEDATAPVSE